MPGAEEPHYAPWSERLGQILDEDDGPLVVVGHSLGGSALLKHVAETERREPITGLLLVAVPFWGREEDWELEWALPENWPDPSTKLPPTFILHSRDDEEVPFAHLGRYAQRIPAATPRLLEGNGHLFDHGELTEIAETVRALAPD